MKNSFLLVLLPLFLSCQNETPASTRPTSPVIEKPNIVKRETVNPYIPVDLSPMDVAYFPVDYPVQKMNGQTTATPLARVLYSRPHRQGRQIFGSIVKWGEPWRLGANEATEIELFSPASVQKKRIEKGKYILYAIPYEDHWTIVFNSNLYTWGLKFNLAKDVVKVDVPVTKKEHVAEHFSIKFEKTASGADLIMAWESTEARLPIQF